MIVNERWNALYIPCKGLSYFGNYTPDQMSNLLTAPVVGFMNGNIPAVVAIVVALQHVIGISKLICLWDIMD